MCRKHLVVFSALTFATLFGVAACDTQRASSDDTGATSSTTASSSPTSSTTSTPSAGASAATSDAASSYDLKFIDTMTQHHRDGLQMAKMALNKASHEELKQMAQKMIDSQQQEITKMQSWRDSWFANAPAAVDHQMPGMAESMKSMPSDMQKLMRAKGDDFDHQFMDVMAKHHDSGIAMSKDALQKSQRTEIKDLANKIVDEQSKDNEKMKTMSAQWFPGHSHEKAARGQ